VKPTELAAAVAEILRDAVASAPIPESDVEQRHMPIYDLSELAICRVPVLPTDRNASAASRGHSNREHVIRIAPQWKATLPGGVIDDDQVEKFIDFVIWIDETIEAAAKIGPHTWISSSIEPLYDLEQLREQAMLTSLITINFKTLSHVTRR